MTNSKQETTNIGANTPGKSGIQIGVSSVLHMKVLCVTAGRLRMEVSELEYLILNVYSSRHLTENNQCYTVMQWSSNTSE